MTEKIDESLIEDWNDEDELVNDTIIDSVDDHEKISTKYAESQLRVVRETKDLSLDYLLTNATYGKSIIDTSPAYQRRLRWNNKKRSSLIESLLLNIPIPPVFLYEKDYNEYEVVDGRQRVEATINYLKNNFPLIGLNYWKELNGKRFNELPSVLRKGLLRRSLSSIVLLAETTRPTDTIDIRTMLFERLNTGGEKLNPQELRNAIYQGSFNNLLFELSENKTFRKIWGIPDIKVVSEEDVPQTLLENTLYKTMTDCELILRYFTIKLIYQDVLKGSIKTALDKTISLYQNVDQYTIESFKNEYISTLDSLYEIFGDNIFLLPKSNRISRSLYDSLMVAYSMKEERELRKKIEIKKLLSNALNDTQKYNVLIGKFNTIESVKDRINLAMEVLFK